MYSDIGPNEMRLPQKRRRQFHLSKQPTMPAFLINALILMALMVDIEVVAIHAPHITQVAPGGRSVRDNTREENYQSNYEDDAAMVSGISTGYTLAHNYYQNAASHSVADNTPTYGDTAGNTATARYENLQRFRDATDIGFIPSTLTAAGQHHFDAAAERVVGAEHSRHNAATSPQIGGIRAMGQYRTPAGKIDYEINAANYDGASEHTGSGMKADEQSTDVIETNNAYNIAVLQNIAHLQQQQQQNQLQEQPQQQLQQHQHQLAYTAESTPMDKDHVDKIMSFKNYDAPPASALAYEKIKHEHPNVNEQYLHNLEMLQYGNYERKPTKSGDMFNQELLLKGRQHNQTYSYTSYEQPAGHTGFRINHHAQEHQHYEQNSQGQHLQQLHYQIHNNNQHRNNEHSDDSLKSQLQHYYAHARTPRMSHERSLNLHDDSHNSFQSQLPSITRSALHTPAISAALSGITLSRHVEVVRHVPVPHYKREHIPYNHSVPIEVPHPIITTVSRPVPINIPVTQTVAVPQLQVVRIPIEKVKPMPVERAIPFIVEKRVPYQVEKQVAKPVYYPYPIRVPVVTTVVHKVPHNRYPHQTLGHHHHPHPRQLLYTQSFTKKLH